MIRAVLFDMDGTLIDSMPIYEDAWDVAQKKIGFQGDVLVFRTQMAGRSRNDIGEMLKQSFGNDFPFEAISAERDRYILEYISKNGVPYKPGVPEIFAELKRQGLKLALVTSSAKKRVDIIFQKTGLDRYFDLILTGDCVKHSKPEPDIFLLAAEKLNVSATECVVAEDAPAGVVSGYRAGMRVAMIPDRQPLTDDIKPMLWKTGNSLQNLPAWISEENRKVAEKQ